VEQLPPGATSVLVETGRTVAPQALLSPLLDRIDQRLSEFERSHGRPDLAEWLDRAAFLGENVAIVDQRVEREGRFVGIDPDGALVLEDPSGASVRVVSGDLTRGPRQLNDL
jgi:BirA family biotin operon repressor/biotin-[acetyl-CoA-carboxylase] ligase